MAAILLEADEIIVKPFEVGRLAELVREKMLARKPAARLEKERVGMILRRCVTSIVEDWLVRAKQSSELSCLALSDEERTGHLPQLVEDLALRLSQSIAMFFLSSRNKLRLWLHSGARALPRALSEPSIIREPLGADQRGEPESGAPCPLLRCMRESKECGPL